jgi:hypothetical protein
MEIDTTNERKKETIQRKKQEKEVRKKERNLGSRNH